MSRFEKAGRRVASIGQTAAAGGAALTIERHTAEDATDTLSSSSRALVTEDCGDPDAGWFNVTGKAYCQNANPGNISLQYSTDDGSSWTSLQTLGIHNMSGEYCVFNEWAEYPDDGTGFHVRLYVTTEGSQVRFELSGDSRWGADVRAVGPFATA